MTHSHTAKVVQWGLDENIDYKPILFGCTDCDETFTESPSNGLESKPHEHTTYVHDCFTCKIETLQLSTGDANGNMVAGGWTAKKWDSELNLYESARKQGIQPDGTSRKKVQAAIDASNEVGVAYAR